MCFIIPLTTDKDESLLKFTLFAGHTSIIFSFQLGTAKYCCVGCKLETSGLTILAQTVKQKIKCSHVLRCPL